MQTSPLWSRRVAVPLPVLAAGIVLLLISLVSDVLPERQSVSISSEDRGTVFLVQTECLSRQTAYQVENEKVNVNHKEGI